jgi:hypothetical protein
MKNKIDIIVPIVHLNGTSREELVRVRVEAHRVLEDAYAALKRMAPNGRDYYPVPGLMDRAVEQHSHRLSVIGELIFALEKEVYELEKE